MVQENTNKLYDPLSLKIMLTAEEAFVKGANRLQEIKNFARKAGIKRIGIAHCIALQKEAEIVKQFLSDEFEVFSIDCKNGHIPKNEMLGIESNAIMCNPAGQADYLKACDTQMNIVVGLCVGHDMIFNQKSAAPVTTLVVKDRVNKHNPVEGIMSITQNAPTKK